MYRIRSKRPRTLQAFLENIDERRWKSATFIDGVGDGDPNSRRLRLTSFIAVQYC